MNHKRNLGSRKNNFDKHCSGFERVWKSLVKTRMQAVRTYTCIIPVSSTAISFHSAIIFTPLLISLSHCFHSAFAFLSYCFYSAIAFTPLLFSLSHCFHSAFAFTQLLLLLSYCFHSAIVFTPLLFSLSYCFHSAIAFTQLWLLLSYCFYSAIVFIQLLFLFSYCLLFSYCYNYWLY